MAAGGAVLFGGILVLLAAVVLVLALWLPAWLAALIVGGIFTVIGYVMVQGGKKTFEAENIKPNRTQEALRQDKAMLERRMT
jgi:predicted phage tail protein